ncbi:hypothetical protein [Kibdelosporangium persicum]|uniref:hypothetical protein n=1 Tax=Kibdelosporangium persicum TaxID=2698649 RepID=UPI0039F02461
MSRREILRAARSSTVTGTSRTSAAADAVTVRLTEMWRSEHLDHSRRTPERRHIVSPVLR